MPNPVNKLQFDASGAETALAQITRALQAQNTAVAQLTNTYATFNAKGNLVGATLKGITDSGQNFEAFVKRTKTGLQVITNVASQTEAATRRLQKSLKEATGKAEFAKAQPDLLAKFVTPANISNVDRQQLDNLLRGALKFVKTGDVGSKDLSNILKLAQSGSKQVLSTDELEKTRLKVLQVIKEYEKLLDLSNKRSAGPAPPKTNPAAAAAAAKAIFGQGEFNQALTNVVANLKLPASVSNIQRQQFDKLVKNSLKNVAAGDVTAIDFDAIFQKARAGNKDMLRGLQEDTRLAVLAMLKEYEKLNARASGGPAAAGQGAKRSKAADLAVNRVKDMFDFDKINPRRLEDVYQQIDRIQRLLLSGKLDFGGFRRAVNAFRNDVQGPLKGAEETVRASLARIARYADETTPSFDNLKAAAGALWAQLTYSAGQELFDQFKAFSQHAADFQHDLALIRTLSQDSKQTLDDWSDGVIKVSNQLGIANHDVAKAAYDLLSNQVTSGSDTFTMLNTAGKFALASNSSIEDSVNLISSAIHAYRLSTADAEKISANFFAAIDLGRVKASDLANNLGRLATTMTSLAGDGMNALTETNAILTVMTRQGIQPDTSQVLLTNVLQKMLHPTKELQEVYHSLGASSGEMFVKTYGLIGAFEKLIQVTGGNKAKLTDFFNEIRSSQGGRILLDRIDEIKQDKAAIEKVMNQGGNYKGAVNLTTENYGQRFAQESQKLANMFTTNFEMPILRAVINLTDKFGGLARVVATVGIAAGGLAAFGVLATGVSLTHAMITGQTILQATVLLTIKNIATMTAAFLATPLGWITVAVAAGAALGVYLAKITNEYRQWPEEIRKATEEQKRLNLAALDAHIADERSKFRDQAQANQTEYLKYLAAYAQQLTKVRDKQHEVADSARNDMANALEVALSNMRKVGSELEGAMTRAKEAAKEAAKAMRELQDDNVDRQAKRATKRSDVNVSNMRTYYQLQQQNGMLDPMLDPEEQAQRHDESGRILQQQLEWAKRRANTAFQSGDLTATLESFKTINQLMDEMATKTHKVAIRDAFGMPTGQHYEKFNVDPKQSEAAITAEYQRQLSLLDQIKKRKEADAEVARQQLEANKNLVAALQDLSTKLSKFNPFDNKGRLKEEYQGVADVMREIITLQNKWNEAAGKMHGTQQGNVDSYRTLGEQLQRVREKTDAYRGAIGQEVETERLQTRTMDAEDKVASATDAATRAHALAGDTAKRTGVAFQNAWQEYRKVAEMALKFNTDNIDNSLGERFSRGPVARLFNGKTPDQPSTATQHFRNADMALQSGNWLDARKELKAYEEELKRLGQLQSVVFEGDANSNGKMTAQNAIEQMRASIATLQESKGAYQQAMELFNNQRSGLPETKQLIQDLQSQLGPLDNAGGNFGLKFKEGVSGVNTELQSLLQKVEAATQALNGMQTSARAARDAATETLGTLPADTRSGTGAETSPGTDGASATPQGYRLGGLVRYANDGFMADFLSGRYRKGTDTIPIMANRNETIMNAYASRRFYPQLVAMNRGIDPSRQRATGGSVTHVGGIHVTVAGGPTDKHSVNNIVNGINRAARRGAVKIGGHK